MSLIYLIPCPISEDGIDSLSPQILPAVKSCQEFFVENERSARRYVKKLWREMVIDDYRWFVLKEESTEKEFRRALKEGKHIGIISEAGCPGVADPGQELVAIAQDMKARVIPLVGPSSILLALMASGMNGQNFSFRGYLPIDNHQRIKALKDLEALSRKENSTQIFIETPYRNNQIFQTMIQHLHPETRVCVAMEITGVNESVRTMRCADWKKEKIDLHKKTVIFLMG